ncbi:MAG: hypothetical protein LIO86_03460, partial [Lachnospiraceae bacterium]|nr:hypothetical protein [Lachnospiraceae bacterium]
GRGVHEVSVSSVKSKYADYAGYASIPIVFSSKTSLNRNSRIVKRLQGYREGGKIYCFPVFITETAMNADEILDFKVDKYVIREIGEENLTEMKNEISYLLLSFIHFLSRISDANLRGPGGDGGNDFTALREVEQIFCDVGEAIKGSGEPARLELSYYQWLNASIKTFCYFLSVELSLKEQACRLKERAKAFFSSAEVELSDYESKSETEEEALLRFGEYIEALFSDGNGEEPYFHYMKRDTGKIYKGEECYYLGYREFFQDFQAYDQKKTHISEERLKVLLKDKDLLVMRPDGRQYGVERGFGNGKRTVLVIKKEPFDELCGLGASHTISESSVQ